MKKYRFEIVLREEDLEGDEFWEGCLEQDPTGIQPLTKALIQQLEDSHIIAESVTPISQMIRLINYTDEEN
jgi:hypothetical protein